MATAGRGVPRQTRERNHRLSATVPLPVTRSTNDAKPWVTNHQTAVELGRDPDREKRPKRDPVLDTPSERVPLLDRLMDEALRMAALTADGSVMRLQVRIRGGGGGSDSTPMSDLGRTLDRLTEDYTSCKTHRARLRVIKEAQDTVTRLRYAPDRSRVRGTREWKEAIAADARPCRKLAVVYGVSHMTIARIKKAAA